VLFGREFAGRDEQLADRVGDRRQPVDTVELVCGHLCLGLLFDGLDVEVVFLQYAEEVVVELDEHLVALDIAGDVLVEGDVVDRLAAAGGVADHRRGIVRYEAVRDVRVFSGTLMSLVYAVSSLTDSTVAA